MDIDHPPLDTLVLVGNTSAFTDHIGLSESELQDFAEQAMDFFRTRFGLDFTNSVPDATGYRHFENATFLPTSTRPSLGNSFVYTTGLLVGGVQVPRYYPSHAGEYNVVFSGPQILHGTYGGATGIVVGENNGESLVYMIWYVLLCYLS